MKPYFFFTSLCFLLANPAAFAITQPTITFPSKLMAKIAGVGSAKKYKGKLSCSDILTKDWPYPSAQTTPFCYAAETSCMSYDLLLQKLKKAKGPEYEILKSSFDFTYRQAQASLIGCKLAIEASMTGSILLPPVGSYAPLLNIKPGKQP